MGNSNQVFFPDLLYAQANPRIDVERLRPALVIAFAGATSGGLFHDALEQARVPSSGWDPRCFASDLFLSRFVTECFRIRIGQDEPAACTSYLMRLLSSPPTDSESLDGRRNILFELASSSTLRQQLEQLYRGLCRLRALLENTAGGRIFDANRRQLDILTVLKKVVDLMATGFQSSTSGLARLTAFGQTIQESEPYRSLSDLIQYDERLATVSLTVSISADGSLRGFQLVSVQENTANPFVNSVWRRWCAKCELFLRGYRFSDREVVACLIDAVFTGVEHIFVSLVQLFGDIEFYLAALGFRNRAVAAGLEVCLPDFVPATDQRQLLGLFNPLLLMSGVVPVPCDIVTQQLKGTILVTGPNSGGKTRLLQSLGLTQLLAQAGVFIPARSGALALAPAMVVSLLEETRADQAEGRLGMELIRIRGLFERLPPGAMVLLDELCSGTNPSEGEEIFELVVSTLCRLEPQVFITTHFLGFTARLERERKIPNLGFLQVQLGPNRLATFQFVPGVAKTSLAGHAAQRLGVTRDQLDELVERNMQHFHATALAAAR